MNGESGLAIVHEITRLGGISLGGNCYETAVAESFFLILKWERKPLRFIFLMISPSNCVIILSLKIINKLLKRVCLQLLRIELVVQYLRAHTEFYRQFSQGVLCSEITTDIFIVGLFRNLIIKHSCSPFNLHNQVFV